MIKSELIFVDIITSIYNHNVLKANASVQTVRSECNLIVNM